MCQPGLFLKQISIVNKHSVFTLIFKLDLGVSFKTTEAMQLKFYSLGSDRVHINILQCEAMPISFMWYIPTACSLEHGFSTSRNLVLHGILAMSGDIF